MVRLAVNDHFAKTSKKSRQAVPAPPCGSGARCIAALSAFVIGTSRMICDGRSDVFRRALECRHRWTGCCRPDMVATGRPPKPLWSGCRNNRNGAAVHKNDRCSPPRGLPKVARAPLVGGAVPSVKRGVPASQRLGVGRTAILLASRARGGVSARSSRRAVAAPLFHNPKPPSPARPETRQGRCGARTSSPSLAAPRLRRRGHWAIRRGLMVRRPGMLWGPAGISPPCWTRATG